MTTRDLCFERVVGGSRGGDTGVAAVSHIFCTSRETRRGLVVLDSIVLLDGPRLDMLLRPPVENFFLTGLLRS